MYPISSASEYHLAHLDSFSVDWHSCFCQGPNLSWPEMGFKATTVPNTRNFLKIRQAKLVRCGAQSGLAAWKLRRLSHPYFCCASASLRGSVQHTHRGIAPHCNLDPCYPNSESEPNFMIISTLSMSISWDWASKADDEAQLRCRISARLDA